MRPIGKTNVFKHSKNKYSSGGKTWNCSLWKKWLYEGNGEPGVQSKKNVGFPLVESLRSWQESAKVPLKLWLAPPCEVAANQEDPLKMALHHHPNVVKPCYTVRYSCRFPSLSADGWKHCASFQLWHFILGCHDFLRNNRHSIKKNLDIFTVIPWKKTCFCTLSFCWASPFLPTAPMPVKHLIQLYFSKFLAHFKQWALYFNYRVYISRLTHRWLKKKSTNLLYKSMLFIPHLSRAGSVELCCDIKG